MECIMLQQSARCEVNLDVRNCCDTGAPREACLMSFSLASLWRAYCVVART